MEKQNNEDTKGLGTFIDLTTNEKIMEKVKKPRSEKQLEVFKKAQAVRNSKLDEKRKIKEEENKIKQKEIEDKIVQKAISIKKTQLKKEKVLDDIPDDNTPIEEIKQKYIPAIQQQPIKKTYNFV
jgi:hypothetical protein